MYWMTMPDKDVLRAADEILSSFNNRLAIPVGELERVFGGNEAARDRSLAFLRDRDQILVAAGMPMIFHRLNVIEAIETCLRDGVVRKATDLARDLRLPIPIVCDALGWLAAEERIRELEQEGGSLYFIK